MSKRSGWTQSQRDRENDSRNARRAARVRAANPHLPPYEPRALKGKRGPEGAWENPKIHEGLQLSRQSVFTGQNGESRWDISTPAAAEPAPIPDTMAPSRISVYVRPDGSEGGRHIRFDPQQAERDGAMLGAWKRHAALYAGLAELAPAPAQTISDLLTLYPLGDPHIGMMSWSPETGANWDLKIACRHFLACVRELVASAPASERAIVTNLGDFLHAQDDSQLTPGHHNKQDVDGRFAKVLDAGHVLLRGIVDMALAKHRHVTVRNLPGNHDPRVAAELAFWLRAVYEKEPRVTVEDAFAVHQYDRFGQNLIGWTHGDASPMKELPAIMAVDRAFDWGETLFRVWETGHVHHRVTDEFPGCDVEAHGILPPGDAWHARRFRSRRRMSAITLHRDYGEVARASVGIERVRAILAREAQP